MATCALLAGCDQGHQDDSTQTQVPPASVHVVASNVCPGQPGISPSGRIELAFDRLILPMSVTRQTFILTDKRGNSLTPQVAYDPVARIVTLTPTAPLEGAQVYQVFIASPGGAADPNGLRAIDGATLDPAQPIACNPSQTQASLTFMVDASASAPSAPPSVDFCRDIQPIFANKCLGSNCHGGALPAAGLELDSNTAIVQTAVGRVAQGSNTGPRAASQPPGPIFGIDMPTIDPGSGVVTAGDPADSWLLYKLLMAVPATKATTGDAMNCDGGLAAPTVVSAAHTIPFQPLSDAERAVLSNLVPGREMPYPTDPKAPLSAASGTLTVDELERVSLWIGQARPSGEPLVPAMCGCIQ